MISRRRTVDRSPDDRGSLAMAILVMVVGLGLAALLLPMVLSLNSTARFDDRRGVSLQAAESGLDTALGLIRSAVTFDDDAGLYRGDPRKLPCGPLKGSVDPNSDMNFTVAIAYYTGDPSGQDTSWLSANKMACESGFGVYFNDDSAAGLTVPRYVLVTSSGQDGSGAPSRTLQATYTVSTTNVNIDGGQLPLYLAQKAKSSDPDPIEFCLDAGSTPKVGTVVLIQPCLSTTPTPDRQRWSYRPNLTLRLTATIGDTALNSDGTGLCITSRGSGLSVTLQPCPPDATNPQGNPVLGNYTLTWGINDSGQFALSNSDKSGLSSSCLAVTSLTADTAVTSQTCSNTTTDPQQAFNPRPTVGSGQAGPDEPDPDFLHDKQVVNFLQFSRCIDVTNQDVGMGTDAKPGGGKTLILYPCKQNPAPGAVAWNQKFTQVSVTGGVLWKTRKDNTDYCITSPLTAFDIAKPTYVHVEVCDGGSDQTWIRNEGYTGEGESQQALADKVRYTLVDQLGLCLAPSPNEDMYNENLKTVVAKCDGSLGQKWNVPPIDQQPTFTNLHEGVSVGEG